MISHEQMQQAMRDRALTLSVVTTGATSLSATATGYARAAGSFLTDGFRIGMELVGTSFSFAANNAAKAITAVDALTLTCAGCVVETAGTRTLTVGLPALRDWENLPFTSVVGRPYVREQYLPGPMAQVTLGPLGELEADPLYVLQIFTPTNTGFLAAAKYADALLAHFAPRTALTLTSGDVLTVRTNPAPFRGQLLQDSRGQLLHAVPGWAVVPVTIPFRCRTATVT
jgi:hypothetical protein